MHVAALASLQLPARRRGFRDGHKEEMLSTLHLLHVLFNLLWNGWCPLKGRAMSLTGVRKLSPSEMPGSLSITAHCPAAANSHPALQTTVGRRKFCWVCYSPLKSCSESILQGVIAASYILKLVNNTKLFFVTFPCK